MAARIVSLVMDFAGQVGDLPRRGRMITLDDLATITAAGYLNSVTDVTGIPFLPTDIIDIIYSFNTVTQSGTYAQFNLTIVNGIITMSVSMSSVTAAQIQKQAFTYAVASGSANNYNITLDPAPAAYTDGMYVMFRSVTNNTGASAANVNGLGAVAIVTNNNSALVGGEILNGGDYLLIYNSSFSKFVLINSSLAASSVTPAQIQNQAFTYAVDSGAANAYVVSLSPAISAYADGQYLAFQATNANSGASTIAVNGLTAQPIVDNANAAIASGAILAGGTYLLVYNGGFSAYVLVNSSAGGGGGIANDGMITNGIVTSTSTTNAKSTANLSFDQTNFNLVVGNGASAGTGNTNATVIGVGATIQNSAGSGTMLLKDAQSTFSGATRSNHLYFSFADGMTFDSSSITPFSVTGGDFIFGSGVANTGKQVSSPSTGDNVTVNTNSNNRLILTPSGTLSTLTITLFDGNESPGGPLLDGQTITISTTQAVTTLTVASFSSHTIDPSSHPSGLTAGQSFTMVYHFGTSTWLPG